MADCDLAACHNLGVDTHIDVVESTLEGGDNIEVPFCGSGIDLRRRTSGDRRDHPQPGRSDGDFRLDPVELTPRHCAVEVNIRPKPERVVLPPFALDLQLKSSIHRPMATDGSPLPLPMSELRAMIAQIEAEART